MDDGFAITVTGVEEVQKFLAEAPKVLVLTGFLRALKAGCEPIEKALAANTPISETTTKPSGEEVATGEGGYTLFENQVTNIILDASGEGGMANLGFAGFAGHVANWIEYGHRIVGHKPKLKEYGITKPNPFMRKAAEESADAAIEAFGNSLLDTAREEYEGSD